MKTETTKSQSKPDPMLTNREVARHVKKVKRGDEESVKVLMDFLYPFVAKIINARLRYRESKEDVSQEIFIR